VKLLLIEGAYRTDSGALLKVKPLWLLGLTLPYIAALTPDDIDVDIKNELIEEIDFDTNCDLVGISAMGGSTFRGREIAVEFRKRGKKVIMGGITTTIFPELASGHCDSLVKGEVELVWREVLADFKKGDLKPVYESMELHDLKGIPIPRYDLLMKKNIGPLMPVQATRGCPHRCKYCSVAAFYQGHYRTRPIDEVIRDIKHLKSMGYSRLLFIDDNILANRKYAMALFREMTPFKIHWWGQGALPALDDMQLLDTMADSGCDFLGIGFDTVNKKCLESIDKRFNHPDRFKRTIRELKSRGIHVHASLMFGFDHDDSSSFDATYDLFTQAGVSHPEMHILTPTPGTPLFAELQAQGRLLHKDFNRYYPNQVVYQPKLITPDELIKHFWRTYARFYSLFSIFRRLFGSITWECMKKPSMFLMILFINFKFRSVVMNQCKSKIKNQPIFPV
jgi:radical SAM superfamily enzyme YgiQ (UPF0313 family)